MPTNAYMFFLVALIPLIVGFLYYHPMLMGNAWMKSNGFTKESLEGGNMGLIMGLAYLFSLIIGFFLIPSVIHQFSVFSMMIPEITESGSAAQQTFNELMQTYGDKDRNFGHGALHGGIVALGLFTPVIAINALFERRGWKYVMIHAGYWFITLVLMGGVLCQTLEYAPIS